jgi:hypothetical protein
MKKIVLEGKDAYEVFLKWGGEISFSRCSDMVGLVGTRESA